MIKFFIKKVIIVGFILNNYQIKKNHRLKFSIDLYEKIN